MFVCLQQSKKKEVKISEKNLRKSGSGDNLIANEFMKVREEKFGKSLSSTASTTTADVENESSKKQGESAMKAAVFLMPFYASDLKDLNRKPKPPIQLKM